MKSLQANGKTAALLMFALPVLGFFPISLLTHTFEGNQLGTFLINPLVWLIALGLLVPSFAVVFLTYQRFKPWQFVATQKNKNGLDQIQKLLISFPRSLLISGLLSGMVIPMVVCLVVLGKWSSWPDILLTAYANTVFFSLPSYILFMQGFERWNREIPFSSVYLSMKLGIRFNLVSTFVLSALSCALIAAFKNVMGIQVAPDQAWGQVMSVCLPITLVGLLSGMFNMILLSRGITERILRCKNFVLDMSEGDISKEHIALNSRDELGVLGLDLNLVHTNLNSLIGSTKHSVRKTLHIKNDLLEMCSSTAREVDLIGSRIGQVEQQSQAVKDRVAATLNRVSKFNIVIDELNEGALQQSTMVAQTTGSITEMTASIDNIARISTERMQSAHALGDQAGDGENKMKLTLDHLEKIAKSVEDIRGITGVIQSIAAQTNLLSMNAAIEAAHAGEAGKGFSVVADEIRKLANTSARNSKEITARIRSIVDLIRETVESGSETARTFRVVGSEIEGFINSFQEIELSMSEMRIGGNQILQASERLSSLSQTVKDKANIMNSEANGLSQDMESLRQVADNTLGAMGEVSSSIGAVNNAAMALKENTRQLDKATGEVAVHIDRFKVL